MKKKKYNIGAVARLTGLSTHAIRAWENRYGIVNPERSKKNNRRLYSEEDLEKLLLLKKATKLGFNIGVISGLSIPELRTFIDEHGVDIPDTQSDDNRKGQNFDDIIQKCINAITIYDSERLESIFSSSFVEFGNIVTIEKIFLPLTKLIGEHWSSGQLRIAQEHMATEIMRSFLLKIVNKSHEYINTPVIIVTTPARQMHDMGALIIASIAAIEGWKVIFLGSSLPCEEIAGAINKISAKALALSIVYPSDDNKMNDELVNLRKFIKSDIPIIAGGSAAESYRKTLDSIDAESMREINIFKNRLRKLRTAGT